MQIADKKRYGDKISMQLSKLEDMHDKFREQKEFCFTQMLTEFGIKCGDSIKVNIILDIPTFEGKINVFNISWASDEYVYLTAVNNDGGELNIEPYYLDAYDDFDYVFSEVYDYLSKMEEDKKPTDEFAIATYNYLMEECKFANKKHTDLNMFASELRGHNISPNENLFDVNIGAFCFTIRNSNGYYVCDRFEIWYENGDTFTETIQSVTERLKSKN